MSPPLRIPINPSVLTWAREWFNMSTGYVASKMGATSITQKTIEDWENGEKQPTYRQLQKLAHIVDKPVEIFLYPSVPDIPKPSALYRAVYGEYINDIPTEVLQAISYAKKYQNNLRELTHGRNPSNNLIIRNRFTGNIPQTARDVRKILGIDLSMQKEIRSHSKAFEQWRSALADAGVYVFKKPFDNMDYSGFCLEDPEFPIICVNNTMALQRQIFTLFHELYHLLSGHNGVDFTDDKQVLPNLTKDMQRLERACDSFAAEFLVPTDDFQYEISQIPSHHEVLLHGSYSDVMDDCVNPLSKKYSVSLDVILRKLLDAGCIDSSRYSQLYRNHRPDISRDPGNNGGGNYYSNQVSYLGRPYIHLVMETQEMYGFPDYVTAEYLGESVKNLPQLVKSARGSL